MRFSNQSQSKTKAVTDPFRTGNHSIKAKVNFNYLSQNLVIKLNDQGIIKASDSTLTLVVKPSLCMAVTMC